MSSDDDRGADHGTVRPTGQRKRQHGGFDARRR